MGKIIEFIKDKIYYVMGITIFVIVLIIILSSCSSGGGASSYEGIEQNMVSAAKKYYSSKQERLPNIDGNSVKVSISTLVEAELLKETVDPKNKSNVCTGYVEVTKVGDDYSYVPFLTCAGNYEAKYLKDFVIETKTDELGNGVYNIDNEYIYRGNDVNNYVQFNNMLWRIVKVDSTGDIKLILAYRTDEGYKWDSKYNSIKKGNFGITTNYLITDIRQSLKSYYENAFSESSKAMIVSKTFCIGRYSQKDYFDKEKECSITIQNEKVGLLNATDFKNASLDQNCVSLSNYECTNQNYLNDENINTWLLNSDSDTTHKAYYLSRAIGITNASNERKINPVIYLSNKTMIGDGKGTLENPLIIKQYSDK